MIDVRHSRYLAEHVPGARFVELDGIDNLPSADGASQLPCRSRARARR